MNATTRYERLSATLILSLQEQVSTGSNIVILSPRFGGKSLASRKLGRGLSREHSDRLIECSLFSLPRISDDSAAVDAILKRAPPAMCLQGPGFAELFSSIRDHSLRIARPVILLATDADAMEYQVLARFLDATRALVVSNQLTFVFTGESTLLDLLDEVSEGLAFEEIVLGGYERAEFDLQFNRWLERMQVHFEDVEDALKCCFERTGGNLTLGIAFLKLAINDQVREDGAPSPLTTDDVRRHTDSLASSGPNGSPVFVRAAAMVASAPESWPQLEGLLSRGRVLPLRKDGRPEVLEFAGVAVRRVEELVFASPMMEIFARTHFDSRRFGDFCARELNWNKAVEYYRTIDPDLCARPSDLDDRTVAAAVVNAAGARFNIDAGHGLGLLKVYLAQASTWLLALSEVIFWHWSQEGGWIPESPTPDERTVEEARALLPLRPPPKSARHDYPIQGLCSAGTLLAGIVPDSLEAVTISAFASGRRIGPNRRKLIRTLLNHFAAAYKMASLIARERAEAALRLATSEAITSLYDLLFSGRPRLPEAIANVRARLIKPEPGLSRFVVVLADQDDTDFRPGPDEADSPTVTASRVHGIHEKVLQSGSPDRLAISIPGEPTVWLCLVPLEKRRILHFERIDRPFSGNEMRILTDFAAKLEVALDHGQKRSVLEAAFASIPEPLIVCDTGLKVVYGNHAAHLSFGLTEGWNSAPHSLTSYDGAARFAPQVAETLRKRVPRLELYARMHSAPKHALALTDRLADWQDREVGALIHIQDQTYYHEMLEAFQKVSSANTVKEALEATIASFRQLGHEWIRFYEIEGDALVPRACVDPNHPRARAAFEGGAIKLPRRGEAVLSWRCIFEKGPVVFAYVTQTPRGVPVENCEKFYTELGIEVVADQQPFFKDELERVPGDMWLDCPLLLPEREFGKFTLHCTEKLTGERLAMLRVFSGMLASSIAVIQQHERREHEAEEVGQETTLDAVTHNLGSRLTTLIGSFDEYRDLEKKVPQLTQLNSRFEVQLQQILKLPGRAKDLARAELATLRPFDLVGLVRSFLDARLPATAFTLHAEREFQVRADDARITDLLSELLANSQHFVQPADRMHVTVSISLNPDGKVCVVYRDNGPGIPEHDKERIFETFFSRREGNASTGIGMSVARSVVRAHGGTIEETGTFGRGAEFTIIMDISTTPNGNTGGSCSEYSSLRTR